MQGVRSFLIWTFGVALVAIGAAALQQQVPLAQVAAAAGALLTVVVFGAARGGGPRWFGLRHLFGLFFAALAIAAHWGALFGFAGSPDLASFNFDAVLQAALTPPMEWRAALEGLAAQTSYAAGGRELSGATLTTAWLIEMGIFALFGLIGGHSAYWRPRHRL